MVTVGSTASTSTASELPSPRARTGVSRSLVCAVTAAFITCAFLGVFVGHPLLPPTGRHAARPLPPSFVLWDTETTAWEGSNARSWSGFVPGTQQREHREIIQVSALRVHITDGMRLTAGESTRFHVRPRMHTQLSEYIQRLTNITQSDVDAAPGFAAAAERLRRFVQPEETSADGACATPMLSWGDDFSIVEGNAKLLGAGLPSAVKALRDCSRDIKPIFRAAGLNLTGWHSGTIHRHPTIGHVTVGHVHDAGWDCQSLLLTLQTLVGRSDAARAALGAALAGRATQPHGSRASRLEVMTWR